MDTKVTTLAGALMAGLMSGSAALADPSPSPSPSASPAKMKTAAKVYGSTYECCKNGCDCMDAKKAASKQSQPKKKTKVETQDKTGD
jgi:hypothetical protein